VRSDLLRFAFRRALGSVFVIACVSTLVFLLVHIVPGDPVDIMLGDAAAKADREEIRRMLGLDRSLLSQYFHFWKHLFDGSWGESFSHRLPVLELIKDRFPSTLLLTVASLAVSSVVGIAAGLFAASRDGRASDSLVMAVALAGNCVPVFVVAPLVVLVFSIGLRWLPVSGSGSWSHLVLPAACLGLGLSGFLARVVRAGVKEELAEDYVRTARAKGLGERQVLFRHALRNALVPLLTVFGSVFGGLLAGAVLTETLFDWPGLGRLFYTAFQARDYPLIQGIVLWISATYVLVHAVIDVLYSWADPRISLEEERA
jgi:peptide/nickel transport system permease protein